jgi:methyltransferase (TIGR00027 family)
MLIEVPSKFLTATTDALRYFLIGTTFNAIRILALGTVIGYAYKRLYKGPDTSAMAALGFTILNILLFPVTLLGYVIWVGTIVTRGKASGVSTTAQGPLAAKWTMHNLGVRRDVAADRLLSILPGVPPVARNLTGFPMLLAHRLTGYVPMAFRYPFEGEVPPQYEASARLTFFDQQVERFLPGISQFVILGAGFDTRPYRLPENTPVKSFEVDEAKTQAVKRALLEKAGIDASKVTFVAADFETEDWLHMLTDTGFDRGRPALFLLEGVMIYLDRAAVEDTLRKVASCAKGSVLLFDYFTTEPLESKSLYWRYGRWATRAAGEPLTFGVDSTPPSRERVSELLQSCGLKLLEQRTLGRETATERAWAGFAVAGVE